MGYDTKFKGELSFTYEVPEDLFEDAIYDDLEAMFDEDIREHPEWWEDGKDPDLSYIDLEFNCGNGNVRWNGAEKTYDLPEKINLITRVMRQKWPTFTFAGELYAQGEELGDIWVLKVDENGHAYRAEIKVKGDTVTCPHCKHIFTV